MQREIKFRGQKLDTKEWIYGGYSKHIQDDNRVFITVMSKDHISDIGWHREIIQETVGQFTGLHDKNSKEIYEGDIVKFGNQIGAIGEMQYGCFTFTRKEKYFKTEPLPFWSMSFDYVEVIGNIYDNPELLEVSE